LNEELAVEGMPQIAIGVGVNTGRCVVGNMGVDQKRTYVLFRDGQQGFQHRIGVERNAVNALLNQELGKFRACPQGY
jgi:hypothetical protein